MRLYHCANSAGRSATGRERRDHSEAEHRRSHRCSGENNQRRDRGPSPSDHRAHHQSSDPGVARSRADVSFLAKWRAGKTENDHCKNNEGLEISDPSAQGFIIELGFSKQGGENRRRSVQGPSAAVWHRTRDSGDADYHARGFDQNV